MGNGGGGGAFTALFGLFTIAVLFLLECVKWLLVGTVVAVVLSYRGIRWLYRRHQEKKGIAPGEQKLPEPYMSPVEYRRDSRS